MDFTLAANAIHIVSPRLLQSDHTFSHINSARDADLIVLSGCLCNPLISVTAFRLPFTLLHSASIARRIPGRRDDSPLPEESPDDVTTRRRLIY